MIVLAISFNTLEGLIKFTKIYGKYTMNMGCKSDPQANGGGGNQRSAKSLYAGYRGYLHISKKDNNI